MTSAVVGARARQIKHRIVRALIDAGTERLQRETGKPRQTAMRRSVSDAYYAVFHALCYMAADGTIGWNTPWECFEPIYRSVDHQETKRRLETADARSLDPDVKRLGDIFRDLMKERHTADYDPRPFSRSKAEIALLIALAAEAIDLIEGLSDETYRRLAVLLIAKPRKS